MNRLLIRRSYYLDNETELCYLNSRYYDAQIGRFLTPDSPDYPDPETIGGLNLYAYCYNNPVNYYDPSGHIVVTALLVGLIFGLAALFVLAGALMLYSEQIGNAFAQLGNMVSNSIDEMREWIFNSFGEFSDSIWDIGIFHDGLIIDLANSALPIIFLAEHRKKRPSTKEKHQQGQARKKRDQPGGEKGDKHRIPYRRRK